MSCYEKWDTELKFVKYVSQLVRRWASRILIKAIEQREISVLVRKQMFTMSTVITYKADMPSKPLALAEEMGKQTLAIHVGC